MARRFSRDRDVERTKKPFYQRWWFIALVVVFAIGALGGDDEEVPEVPEEPSTEVVEDVEADESEEVENEPEEIEEAEEEPEKEEVEIPETPDIFEPSEYNADLTYEDLARNPEEHSYKAVTFEGRVVQVMQGDEVTNFRIAINDNIDQIMLIEIENERLETRILEDDYIRFYGTYVGEITYETVLGASMTIPGAIVKYFEFK